VVFAETLFQKLFPVESRVSPDRFAGLERTARVGADQRAPCHTARARDGLSSRRLCAHASVHTPPFTHLCSHASVHMPLFTRLYSRGSVHTPPFPLSVCAHHLSTPLCTAPNDCTRTPLLPRRQAQNYFWWDIFNLLQSKRAAKRSASFDGRSLRGIAPPAPGLLSCLQGHVEPTLVGLNSGIAAADGRGRDVGDVRQGQRGDGVLGRRRG
jgi:hypothetical protein